MMRSCFQVLHLRHARHAVRSSVRQVCSMHACCMPMLTSCEVGFWCDNSQASAFHAGAYMNKWRADGYFMSPR